MSHLCPKCKKADLQYRQRVIETWAYDGDPGSVMMTELLSSDPEVGSGWFECPGCGSKIEALALADLLDHVEIDFSRWLFECHAPGVAYLRNLAESFETRLKGQEQYSMLPAYLVGVCAMRFLGVTWPRITDVLQMPGHRIRGRYFSFMRYVGTILSANKEFLVDAWPSGVDIDAVLARKTVHADKYGQQATELLLRCP